MNKSDLLALAIQLYKGVITVYARTSPQYLQIRQYITATFGHDGTRSMQAADSEGIQAQPKQRASITTMRVFRHPISAAKNTPPSNAVPVPVPEGEGEQSPAEQQDNTTDNVPGELEPQNLPLESPAEQQDVAAVKSESKPLEFSDLTGLRASAALERFGVEPLKYILAEAGHPLTGEESVKQIAGIACKLANK